MYLSEVPEDLNRMQLISLHQTYVKEHQCRNNNGNCSHVCLLSNADSYVSLECLNNTISLRPDYPCTYISFKFSDLCVSTRHDAERR